MKQLFDSINNACTELIRRWQLVPFHPFTHLHFRCGVHLPSFSHGGSHSA